MSRCLKMLSRPIFHMLSYLSVVLFKILIHDETVIGRAVCLSRKGNIIIGAKKIGDGCVIHHDVTLGMHLGQNENISGKPSIGNRVWIGPDTIIYGNIQIGDGVTILGGTVLKKNVPPHCVIGGNPAKILSKDFDNSILLGSSCYEVNWQTVQEWAVMNV